MIYLELFWSFFQVGLFSIGGGYAIIPLIQEQVVEHYGWISQQVFTDIITISQMTPGPIAINSATFVGIQIAGLPGAIIATLGSPPEWVCGMQTTKYILFNYSHCSARKQRLLN